MLGRPGEWMQLAAVERDGGALVGDCAVHVPGEPPATAEVGITLAPAHQNRGLGAEALTAVLDALFGAHGMHRVFAQADDRNAAVHRLLERVGFRCEARARRGRLVQGRVDDAARSTRSREWAARGH